MQAQEITSSLISEEDYIKRERDAVIKSEYFRGRVYATAGGTPEHSEIAANTIRELGNALEGKPCSVYTSDLLIASDRIYIEHFSRLEANRWVQQVAIRRDAQIVVASLGITLSVARIYQGLDLPDLNLLPDHA